MRHTVILIPADFGGHEHINSGFFQNLRQGPGIAEHIRKPEIFHLFAELILDEFASDQNLTGQGFSAGQITVGFHPHAAVHFPAAFLYSLFDLLINLRKIFFDVGIQLRLSLQKDVLRKHFHHSQNCGEGTGCFLMSMFQSPQPGHINMRVAHTFYFHQRVLLHPVNLLIEQIIRLMHRLIKFFTSRIRPVDTLACLIQSISQLIFHWLRVGKILYGVQNHRSQIIEIVHFLIQICQIRTLNHVLLRRRNTAAFQSGPQSEGETEGLSVQFLREEHFLVVDVHALIGFFIDITHCLKSGIVAGASLSEIENTDSSFSLPGFRYLDLFVQPQVTVTAAPSVPDTNLIPSLELCGHLGVYAFFFVLTCRKLSQGADFSVTIFSDLIDPSVKLSLC